MTYEHHKRIQRRVALWILTFGVLCVVILLVFFGVSSCIQSAQFSDDRRPPEYPRADHWDPPKQTALQSSMRVKPVPGWVASNEDLGLAPGTRIATDPMPIHSQPLIGNIGDRAFFLVSNGEDLGVVWSLVGLNVDTGQRLFPPVQLKRGGKPYCYLNGPDALLCITTDIDNRTAWVIDSRSGVVTYLGPTELAMRPNDLNVQQVGIYAVAESVDEGVYGIGSRAEPTWFVPGAGNTSPVYVNGLDIDQPPLAFQTVPGINALGKTLFSVTDGRVIEPETPDGSEIMNIQLFPGGFAAEVRPRDQPFGPVMLFDDNGKRMTDVDLGPFGLPIEPAVFEAPVFNDQGWWLFTPDGELVVKTAEPPVRMVGSRLIVDANEFSTRSWDQYDIHTGARGKRCANLDMAGGYIGHEKTSIVVTSDGNPTIGLDTEATDLNTCERLWTISSLPGSSRYVWRINTTLVQLSDDGTELMSLVAPS
ncbi:hypothetical protein [Mycolicibacterium iranicum]|uniref:Pyrrolo-quinoline quinone n=1 Tax=Mycolicibacterium iranicum TaxID=912594 RepID=A0A1X1WGU4_MYCIR|nr:hypothetical protein [Mycolicibacterium iranicum]ORV85779.1 hypothetical protein AWC12_19815 [Mycolicibacterium iranicum]